MIHVIHRSTGQRREMHPTTWHQYVKTRQSEDYDVEHRNTKWVCQIDLKTGAYISPPTEMPIHSWNMLVKDRLRNKKHLDWVEIRSFTDNEIRAGMIDHVFESEREAKPVTNSVEKIPTDKPNKKKARYLRLSIRIPAPPSFPPWAKKLWVWFWKFWFLVLVGVVAAALAWKFGFT